MIQARRPDQTEAAAVTSSGSSNGCAAKMTDLITICVPTHRRPTLLLQTLFSCFAQDYRPLEIDIGDDSPGDESERLVRSLELPDGISVRYRRNAESLGQAGNVNRLFGEARAERLVLLHDDDLLLPGAISAMAAAWSRLPGVVAVYGMQQILKDSGELDQAETDFKAFYYKRDKAHVGEQRNLLESALWRQFPNNGYLIETQAARNAGYRSFEEIGHACDTDFSIRLAMYARGRSFFMIDRLTSQYRYNLNSLSRSVDVTWRFYDYLHGLDGLTPAEAQARDSLLREIAAQATKENALHGRRRAALQIFFSRFYPRNQTLVKSIYHLGLTVSPRLHMLRRVSQLLPFSSPQARQRRALARAQLLGKKAIASQRPTIRPIPINAESITDRPLTITVVSQYVKYGHGQGRANLELVREALHHGHHVNVVASDVDIALCDEPNVTLHLLDVEGVQTQLLRDVIFDLRAQRIVRRLRRTSDIVHVNGAVVSATSDINTAHFVHGMHARFQSRWTSLIFSPYRLYQYAYTILNTVMERRSFRRATAVVAVSQKVAQDLIELGVDRRKIHVIYNGIDLREFSPGPENRSQLGLPLDVPLALFVGDIKNSRKNLDTVLKAMVSNSTLHLAVLADFTRTAAPALAVELGIDKRVHFLGERSDVAAIMRAADMLVFPSRYEPFGMVILEALASGLPVVVSRAAGASEIVKSGCGIVVEDPNDVDELATAIRLLVGNTALCRTMGTQGRLVAENYSWQSMAEQYMACYQNVVAGVNGVAEFQPSSGQSDPMLLRT